MNIALQNSSTQSLSTDFDYTYLKFMVIARKARWVFEEKLEDNLEKDRFANLDPAVKFFSEIRQGRESVDRFMGFFRDKPEEYTLGNIPEIVHALEYRHFIKAFARVSWGIQLNDWSECYYQGQSLHPLSELPFTGEDANEALETYSLTTEDVLNKREVDTAKVVSARDFFKGLWKVSEEEFHITTPDSEARLSGVNWETLRSKDYVPPYIFGLHKDD